MHSLKKVQSNQLPKVGFYMGSEAKNPSKKPFRACGAISLALDKGGISMHLQTRICTHF